MKDTATTAASMSSAATLSVCGPGEGRRLAARLALQARQPGTRARVHKPPDALPNRPADAATACRSVRSPGEAQRAQRCPN